MPRDVMKTIYLQYFTPPMQTGIILLKARISDTIICIEYTVKRASYGFDISLNTVFSLHFNFWQCFQNFLESSTRTND